MRLTRRQHPLEGESLEVVTAGPTQIVARLRDGTTMRLPRAWSDADGALSSRRAERVFTVDALRELIERIDALGRRP